ncbi:hypothetical protein [Lederbergia citri]|uniref:Uncharacterized protein n=1 Tax=Lederbergia citri TaxID=2833580 RepID=A0A942TCQ5_9BACI|nr:hypothetical protein [Lederbergia citri]MBS4195323.1 hypothetical protein [Lederbergia citri]
MIDIREHGGNFGGGGGVQLPVNYGKTIKQIIGALPFTNSSTNPYLYFFKETKNYIWWYTSIGGNYYLYSARKNDLTTLKIRELGSSIQINMMIPLYDIDKIVCFRAGSSIAVYDEDFNILKDLYHPKDIDLNGNFITYFFDAGRNILLLCFAYSATHRITALDFSNLNNISVIYSKAIFTLGGQTNVWAVWGFEPENDAFRAIALETARPTKFRYKITTGELISTINEGGFGLNNVGLKPAYGTDKNTMICIFGNELFMYNLNTGAWLQKLSRANLENQILTLYNKPKGSILSIANKIIKLKNGIYVGAGSYQYDNVGFSPRETFFFGFDDRLTVLWVESDLSNMGFDSNLILGTLNELERTQFKQLNGASGSPIAGLTLIYN